MRAKNIPPHHRSGYPLPVSNISGTRDVKVVSVVITLGLSLFSAPSLIPAKGLCG
ncbi:MAG: hypothetical protein ACO2OT_01080 [Candidatus Caldipriscus sp.]